MLQFYGKTENYECMSVINFIYSLELNETSSFLYSSLRDKKKEREKEARRRKRS